MACHKDPCTIWGRASYCDFIGYFMGYVMGPMNGGIRYSPTIWYLELCNDPGTHQIGKQLGLTMKHFWSTLFSDPKCQTSVMIHTGCTVSTGNIGRCPKIYPKIMHFKRKFHYTENHPSGGTPVSGNPICVSSS